MRSICVRYGKRTRVRTHMRIHVDWLLPRHHVCVDIEQPHATTAAAAAAACVEAHTHTNLGCKIPFTIYRMRARRTGANVGPFGKGEMSRCVAFAWRETRRTLRVYCSSLICVCDQQMCRRLVSRKRYFYSTHDRIAHTQNMYYNYTGLAASGYRSTFDEIESTLEHTANLD